VGLPVLVDPSHAAGHHALVAPLARAAVAAGADGLIVEVHPRPHQTRCDAMQALAPEAFAALMDEISVLAAALGRQPAASGAGEAASGDEAAVADEAAPTGEAALARDGASTPASRGSRDDEPGLRRAMGA
jgi:3-deoxy-7-phosphoheptulonate synthase